MLARQLQPEAGARLVDWRIARELSSQELSPPVRECQPQADAATRDIMMPAPPKRPKYRPLIARQHAGTPVFHFQKQRMIGFPARPNPNPGIRRTLAIFAGIVNKISQDLRHQLHIGDKL